MSHPHATQAADAGNGDDGVNLKLIVVVGVISLVVFAISAVIAWWILGRDNQRYAERGVAPEVRGLAKKEEVGIIDYVPFDGDRRLANWNAEKTKTLNSYGWVDRSRGLVHIPIEEAMKEVIRQGGGGGTK